MPVSRPRWPSPTKPPRVAITFIENKNFMEGVKTTARKVMQERGRQVKAQAKKNVKPGVGPGPHPHVSSHKDTGNLMRSIFYRTWEKGLDVGFMVGTNVDYGFWLEIGWFSSRGRFFRYEWLKPALLVNWDLALKRSLAKYRF